MRMENKVCAFTGHRPNKLPWRYDETDSRCVALKAVLTEHNCGWSFYELYQELRQEHEKMNARQEKEYEKMSAGAEEASVKEES